jgi:AAA+ ATPase superfamily predicted ATPase
MFALNHEIIIMLIGRDKEQAILLNLLEKQESQFCVIYGRRRVGKTYLIRQTYQNNFLFAHTGVAGGSKATQLKEFYMSLLRYGLPKQGGKPNDWSEAFMYLLTLVEKAPSSQKKVIFLDELSWLDAKQSGFVSALEHFWNGYLSAREDIVLVTCCSSTTWIINNIINNTGGLYNRITEQINLQPFTLKTCREYAKAANLELSNKDIAEAYMIMGGIPYYWSFLRKSDSLAKNIDRLFFYENATFKNEFHALYASIFKRPENYINIVQALGSKKYGMKRDEILKTAKLSNNAVFKRTLLELEQSGFIRSYKSFGKRKNDTIYQLIDNFTLFYLQFMQENKGHEINFWSYNIDSPTYYNWAGLAFERLCLWHISQIKAALGIAGVYAECSAWHQKTDKNNKGIQIDLIIDRKDGIINLCEMKYSNSEYTITKEYSEWLQERREIFRHSTKSHKSIHLTMITSFGIKRNAYWNNIQSEIRLDDLFIY